MMHCANRHAFYSPVLTGSVQVRLVSVASLSGGGGLVINHDRTASFSRQDSNSIGQDGKCNRQAVKIHDRMVSRWAETQSGYRVMEGW